MILRGSRAISLLLVALTAAPTLALAQVPPPPPPPAPPAPSAAPVNALAEIAAGDKATRARDFPGALTHYSAAQAATPSARAEMGVGDALYNAGRLGEAYDTYNDVQTTYAGKLGPVEKGLVTKRLKELATKTGYLSVRVSEAGAEVDIDGKQLGMSPVPTLVRVPVGTHEVHIVKAGFTAFDSKAEVAADGKAVVDATLAAVATQGHVVVHSTGPEPLRVILDGVDVGATPWEGDLAPGSHQIAGRSSTSSAQAQTVDVTAGSKTAIDLVSADTAGHLQITTSDGKGVIYVDGVVKGEGKFTGDFAPGPHTVAVSRDGYQRYDKTVTLAERQTWAETVTLSPVAAAGGGQGEAEHAYGGIYGGFGLFGAFGFGGMGTTIETNCNTLGAATCDTPNPLGGGAFGYIGYTWDPVGFELAIAGMADQDQQKATFSATSASTSSVLPATNPARTETFSFIRIGGLAALRARVAFQSHLLRGTISAGPGISYRLIQMQRDAEATDNTGRSDKFAPSPVGYLSPAISIEGALHIRLSPTVALALGATFWADNASIAGSNSTPPESKHGFAPSGTAQAAPIQTPGYNLATGPQLFIGPFLGMQFGP